ncbi:TetR/AcrR family transcriptional regulator [Streptomyces sp. NPDC007088]|uniref:TetR/AcrR family transcriptional regulator n=1 Tax=Streptomyces sp. NPDC007088 TaxID=3364773 RepID=UPI0036B5D06F
MARSNAEDRRAQVIDAAIALFAHAGYEGTRTSAIAARVGVSQPYLFQLFPTKKAIFIAAWRAACGRIVEALTAAVAQTPREQRLPVLAKAYDELVTTDRDLLTIQIHAWSASASDTDIAEATRAGIERLRESAIEQLGISADQSTRLLADMAFYNISVGVAIRHPGECTVTHLLQQRG